MIPRKLHAFWDGPAQPDYVKRALASWEALHPGWDLIIWDEQSLPELRNQDLYDSWAEVSPKSNEWQFKTNLARLEILFDQGGVWIDADLEALRNVEPLIDGCPAFTSRENPEFVNNGFCGTIPEHPWFQEMLDKVRARVLNHPGWRSNKQSGPHHFTETVRHHKDVRILPTELIYPIGWRQANGNYPSSDRLREKYPNAYTVHFWHNKVSGGKRG